MNRFAAKMMAVSLTGMLAVAALTGTTAFAAEAAEDTPMLIATQEVSFGRVVVDGEDSGIDACVLVPLYKTAKKLGFTVKKQKDGTYLVDDGVMHTVLTKGVNSYTVTTSQEGMVGMSAPFSLSAAPTVVNKKMYVPVELFEALLGNENRVTLENNTVSVSTKEETTEIPNPMTEHATVDELSKAVGFTVKLPTMPEGYAQSALIDISGEIADVRFTSGEKEICYRVAKGSDDLSGDYNTYKKSGTMTFSGVKVAWRGTDGVNVATWTKDGYTYSLQMDNALTKAQVKAIVKSVL